jgi:hypothetical protein
MLKPCWWSCRARGSWRDFGEAASIEAPHEEQRDAFDAFLKPHAAQINGLAEPDAMGARLVSVAETRKLLPLRQPTKALTEHP